MRALKLESVPDSHGNIPFDIFDTKPVEARPLHSYSSSITGLSLSIAYSVLPTHAVWCPCCRILDGSRLHRHCTHGCKGYQPLQEKVDTDFILVTANTAQQHIASWQLRMIEAQSLVYQAWMQAGFCTTHLWCCMWACLNDCRELCLHF